MKNLLLIIFLLGNTIFADIQNKPAKTMSVKEKKKRFYSIVVPEVDKVYERRAKVYLEIKNDLNNSVDNVKIDELKTFYKIKTDEELLMALKPIPKSIAIAQAAMESAWGTSRFFKEGNNLYGMWSIHKKDKKIAASKTRDNNVTVWIKQYNSLEDSVRGYYITLAKGKQYKRLRELNYISDDVYEIAKGLDKYSEKRELYVEEIKSIIRYNKLTKYDAK
ncbi:glucosaminidase domain-containing protein [Sulfurimonas sp.]|uniref:glucosaminidase domain-containing protein n=1 Tax=Sulfurimonas sp. TaxID=2022749 RepID=UPI003D0B2656